MLSQYMKPIQGDSAGNDIKWDSLVLETDLYLKTGNYALLRDVRHRQARFVELEGNSRIAAAYYLMVFYGDLNGFRNAEEIISANRNGFSGWKSSATVDPGIVNKISTIIHDCAISDTDLEEFFQKSFIPGIYQCHLFTVEECKEILELARAGKIGSINSRIADAEGRLKQQFGAA